MWLDEGGILGGGLAADGSIMGKMMAHEGRLVWGHNGEDDGE